MIIGGLVGFAAGALAVGWPLGRMWWRAEQGRVMWWRCTEMNHRAAGRGGGTFVLDGSEEVLCVWPVGKTHLTSTDMLKMGAFAYGVPADHLALTIDARGRDVVRLKPEHHPHRFRWPEAGETY